MSKKIPLTLKVFTVTGATSYTGMSASSFTRARLLGDFPEPGIKLQLNSEVISYWSEDQVRSKIKCDVLYPKEYLSVGGIARYTGISRYTVTKKLELGVLGEPDMLLVENNNTKYRKFWVKNPKMISKMARKPPFGNDIMCEKRNNAVRAKTKLTQSEIKEIYKKGYDDAIRECREEVGRKYREGFIFHSGSSNLLRNNEVLCTQINKQGVDAKAGCEDES